MLNRGDLVRVEGYYGIVLNPVEGRVFLSNGLDAIFKEDEVEILPLSDKSDARANFAEILNPIV